jgi:hypothetical protein
MLVASEIAIVLVSALFDFIVVLPQSIDIPAGS